MSDVYCVLIAPKCTPTPPQDKKLCIVSNCAVLYHILCLGCWASTLKWTYGSLDVTEF